MIKKYEPELWGGVECTVTRIGNKFVDQLELNGHATRLSDLELFAELGIKALRYPVLWERIAPNGVQDASWEWSDIRLKRLSEFGIRPIVGLVHHGGGPRYTNLLDPQFPEKLAEFAAAVAERYPWVRDFTPVNEPLTTARFCSLYGHWYPHKRDDHSFARSLILECKGVVKAMEAIRKFIPDARLIQTEDLGRTFSTPGLSYQAQFDNERRWISFDLLMGRIEKGHPLWEYLRRCARIPREDLEFFRENPCPPDVLGINHYVTSDRFLDDRLEHYPGEWHMGNGRDAYVDLPAVRVCAEGGAGPKAVLREAFQRYGLPIAITEAHLACTRDEQMRWLLEVWESACELGAEGLPILAVTAWSLLGAYDWDSLLTEPLGSYEPGLFDMRSDYPRPTALAGLVKQISDGNAPDHPVLDSLGWWRRPIRLHHPSVSSNESREKGMHADGLYGDSRRHGSARKILICGSTGLLGQAFCRMCGLRGLEFIAPGGRNFLDVTRMDQLREAIRIHKPWAVVNASGYVRLDDAETDREGCIAVNTWGAVNLATVCSEANIPLITFSSDQIFDGSKRNPYIETDSPQPLNVYGLSKVEAERAVLERWPGALVVRTSTFFGPWDGVNFITRLITDLESGISVKVISDQMVSPTYLPDLVNATLDLLVDREHGIWHLTNQGAISWSSLAQMAAEEANLDANLIEPVPALALEMTARRPEYSVLSSSRGLLLNPLDNAIEKYFRHRETEIKGRPVIKRP